MSGVFSRPWGNGQPDNTGGNEHCGELWDGDMNDNDCDQHYPYICEKDKCKYALSEKH